MKFKKDGTGWLDLKVEGPNGNNITVCLDTDPTIKAHDDPHFICINDGNHYASFHMTRKRLRKFAEAILKELDR